MYVFYVGGPQSTMKSLITTVGNIKEYRIHLRCFIMVIISTTLKCLITRWRCTTKRVLGALLC